MTTIPVYIKGTDEVLHLESAPKINEQDIEPAPPPVLPKGDAKGTAKSAKITLVLDPTSITRVNSDGKKQLKLLVTAGTMKLEALVSGKSYRKALGLIDSLGPDNCTVILQASMVTLGKLESCGIAVQPKIVKAIADKEADGNDE